MQHDFTAITPLDIIWFPETILTSLLSCPICGTLDNQKPLLSIPSMEGNSIKKLFTCTKCNSQFFNPPEVCAFSEITGDAEYFYKQYCEAGAGIWEMFWPLAMVPRSTETTLLDVGCGFGYTVDCWRTTRGDAIGIELAEYGKIGAALLNIPIYFNYLNEVTELKHKKLDIVYASEVIEHVSDPKAFIMELSAYIKSDGFLVLTTPNSNFIRKKNESPMLIAALSPGFHGFLFSSTALEQIIRNTGFSYVIVKEYNERLVAWASKKAFQLNESPDKFREDYLNYLVSAIEKLSNRHDLVYDGLVYRLFRDQLNAGNITAATDTLKKLEESLIEKYGSAVLQPKATIEALSSWSSNSEFIKLYPYFLPNYFYYRGILGLLLGENPVLTVQYFSASWKFTRAALEKIGIYSFLEAISLIWTAKLHESLCLIMLGNFSQTVKFLEESARAAESIVIDFGFSKLDAPKIETILSTIFNQLISQKRVNELTQTLPILEHYLSRNYGKSIKNNPEYYEITQQALNLYLMLGNAEILTNNYILGIKYLNIVISQSRFVKIHNRDTNQLNLIINQAKKLLTKIEHLNKWADAKISYSFTLNRKE